MSASSVVVGIDVAKAHVDVSVLGAKLDAQRFDNLAEAHPALTAALKPLEALDAAALTPEDLTDLGEVHPYRTDTLEGECAV